MTQQRGWRVIRPLPRLAALIVVALLGSAPAAAALEYQLGEIGIDLLLAAGAQGAVFRRGPDGPSDEDGHLTALARLNMEWTADSGHVFGIRTQIDDGTRQSEDIAGDEFYAYVAAEFGRFELGRQDGPADVMSFHAPVIALGQVRGDFSYYTGRNASLSATDTRDAPKLIYLSPPLRGLRFGASYAPEYTVNADDPDPRRRIVQNDAIELGAQYQMSLPGEWALGASAALVRGSAEPETQRNDLSAWSTGLELRRNELVVGASYVDNGDSNDLVPSDEREWNVGVAWRAEQWSAALSYARIEQLTLESSLLGIGGFYTVMEHVILRGDVVHIDEQRRTGASGDYFVVVFEVGVEF